MLLRRWVCTSRRHVREYGTAKASTALIYQEHGDPSQVLRLADSEPRKPGPADVVVEFLAVGFPESVISCCLKLAKHSVCPLTHLASCLQAPINPSDINQIQGKYPIKPP